MIEREAAVEGPRRFDLSTWRIGMGAAPGEREKKRQNCLAFIGGQEKRIWRELKTRKKETRDRREAWGGKTGD